MGVKSVGLISDTHGLLRKEAVEALRESDLIVHAGDVGKPEILERLREIAPVVAVRANGDTEPGAQGLPDTVVPEIDPSPRYPPHTPHTLHAMPTPHHS